MTWHPVASLDDALLARPWLSANVAGEDIVIARLGDEWFAVEAYCTHADCPFAVEADLEDGTIVCNCHGSEYDLRTGTVQRGPAEDDVRTFPVRVVDGRLEVEA